MLVLIFVVLFTVSEAAVTSSWAALVCEHPEQYNGLAYFRDELRTCEEVAERVLANFNGIEDCVPNEPLTNINVEPLSSLGEGVTADNVYLGTVCCRDGRSLCESSDALIVTKKGGNEGCDRRPGETLEGMTFDIFKNDDSCQAAYTSPFQRRHFIPALSAACAREYSLKQTSFPLGPADASGNRIRVAHLSKTGVTLAECQEHCDGVDRSDPRCTGIAWQNTTQTCFLLGQYPSTWGVKAYYQDLGYVKNDASQFDWVPPTQWDPSDDEIGFVAAARVKDVDNCGASWVRFNGCSFTVFEDSSCQIPADTSNEIYFGDDSTYYNYAETPFTYSKNTCLNRNGQSSSSNDDLSKFASDVDGPGVIISCCQGMRCNSAAVLVASAFLSILYLV